MSAEVDRLEKQVVALKADHALLLGERNEWREKYRSACRENDNLWRFIFRLKEDVAKLQDRTKKGMTAANAEGTAA